MIAVRDGYVPPVDISKDLYYAIKSNPQEYPKELVGFVSFLCSFGAKWWGGYAFDSVGRNYAEIGSRRLVRQSKKIDGVVFTHSSYLDIEISGNSLIYCDTPYANTCKYRDDFNHDIFWDWCRKKTEEGHNVFVSEYNAPEDFVCIKQIQHESILNKCSRQPRIEKLFRYNRR